MPVRYRNGRPIVEVYNPATGQKQHVRPSDFGMEPPPRGASRRTMERFGRQLEAKALEAVRRHAASSGAELLGNFANRWAQDFPRSEATNKHNTQSVAPLYGHIQAGGSVQSHVVKQDLGPTRINLRSQRCVRCSTTQSRTAWRMQTRLPTSISSRVVVAGISRRSLMTKYTASRRFRNRSMDSNSAESLAR